jgi:hypothetical protein
MNVFAAAYQSQVLEPFRAGTDPDVLADELATDPASGFVDPGCPSYTRFAWRSPLGPTLLIHLPLDRTNDGTPIEPLPAASSAQLFPTALEIDETGDVTLYVYGGWLS